MSAPEEKRQRKEALLVRPSILPPAEPSSVSTSTSATPTATPTESHSSQCTPRGASHRHQGERDPCCTTRLSDPWFETCLSTPGGSAKRLTPRRKKGTCEVTDRHVAISLELNSDGIGHTSWLNAVFIDYVLQRFAKAYSPSSAFLPCSFAAVHLIARPEDAAPESVQGTRIDVRASSRPRQLLFLHNANFNHWNLVRVILPSEHSLAGLYLYEPFGLAQRRSHLSRRDFPRGLIEWLDTNIPIPASSERAGRANTKATKRKHQRTSSWLDVSVSAVAMRVQDNSFDCGVAGLLYGEKCAQEAACSENLPTTQTANGAWVDQPQITRFRSLLLEYMNDLSKVTL